MVGSYILVFLISMVPLVELRLAVPMAVSMGLPYIPSLVVCVIGNMIPVPFIYFFARKFLNWGADRACIGRICRFFLEKGSVPDRSRRRRPAGSALCLPCFSLWAFLCREPVPGPERWVPAF